MISFAFWQDKVNQICHSVNGDSLKVRLQCYRFLSFHTFDNYIIDVVTIWTHYIIFYLPFFPAIILSFYLKERQRFGRAGGGIKTRCLPLFLPRNEITWRWKHHSVSANITSIWISFQSCINNPSHHLPLKEYPLSHTYTSINQ